MAGYGEGAFFVQDEASQICVRVLDARAGDTVIDVCSAPGSKSFGAAINMKNTGRVLSFDLHENKLSLIKSGAERLGIDIIETAQADARVFIPELEGKADRVLCDVPCSGFGVLAKKGELRAKDPAESARLPEIQLAILENASRYVKAGGVLVYSTCTILPEENRENIDRFLAKHSEFSLCPFELDNISSKDGTLSLMPDTHGCDGFFVAKLSKKV
jgi:16S rRNA (cytosine967-C5)-methyltransferase